MNPPLHDVALHHHQRVYSPSWFLLQCAMPVTAALTLCTLLGWQAKAVAFPAPSTVQTVRFAQTDELSGERESESIYEPIHQLESELIFEANGNTSASDDTVNLSISEDEITSIDLEFDQFSGEGVVEEPESSVVISLDQPFESNQQQSQDSLIVVDAPVITTESWFDSSVLADTEQPNQPNQTVEVPLVTQAVESPLNGTPDSHTSDDFSDVSYSSQDLANPLVQVQGVYTLQGNESSARARVSASYAITPNVMIGGTVDLTTGDAFSDSPEEGIDLNELYVAVSPTELPNLRFVAGMLDLTSYFDRNSFAKDAATHFLNPVFQSNPALTAAGLGSRPALLINWSVADPVEVKIAGFSSDRDLGDFALDGFAGEVGVRLGNLILRGTYITSRDAGQNDGFREIFQLQRGENEFGLDSDDREQAVGLNAEYFIPEIDLGLFARYGWYENLDLDRSSSTFSVGLNLLDLFMQADRLGLAYGQQLSNSDLRQDEGDDYPDVWEAFYDFQITPNLRAGVTLQSINQFSETIGGFRIRADFDSRDFRRLFR